MKALLITIVITASYTISASTIQKFFVRTNTLKTFKKLKGAKVKYLFGNLYLVESHNIKKAKNDLLSINPNIKIVKNYKSQKSKLPELESLSDKYLKGMSPLFERYTFNDPKLRRVWAFSDASKYGVSANAHFLSPLTRERNINIVAVVDTGVDYNHEDLKANMWINTDEIPGNGIDDDNNGYIDDIHGINTINRKVISDPMASHSHGTHVAGTIAAVQNNNTGIAGLSSAANIMAIRAVPDSADETDADIVESFLYAAKNGAKIINCSFGKKVNEDGSVVNDTINYIGKEYGVLVIAAAGNERSNNDKYPKYPASFDSDYLLVVASTRKGIWGIGKGLSSFSNYGIETVDLAAPGSRIYSTTKNNNYGMMSGTSMASPTTAGVASEVLANFPQLGPLQLKKVLMNSVDTEEKLKKKLVSGGRINMQKAIQYTLENYSSL